ncbi:triose-phosphate isomerase [Patescibacteria group bacterium]|nr:triose-phosphate isomerase [Patescibacteria group bacterium]
MRKMLIANWKMNLSYDDSLGLASKYVELIDKFAKENDIAIAPSFPCLPEIKKKLAHSAIVLGAQDVSSEESGAFTGEVSAEMLAEIGCQYAIVGHSERRLNVNETDEMIGKKINQCFNRKLIPILCIGETSEEKERGERDSILARQLHRALEKVKANSESDLIIAYEPVWAIGTGNPVRAEDLQPVQLLIKRTVCSLFSEKYYSDHVRFIYGGSVDAKNAKEFLQLDFISGLLAGTVSLNADDFLAVAQALS